MGALYSILIIFYINIVGAVFLISLSGYGHAVGSLLTGSNVQRPFIYKIIIGLSFLIFSLEFIHIFFPINIWISSVFLFFGLFLAFQSISTRKMGTAFFGLVEKKISFELLTKYILIIIFLEVGILAVPGNPDTAGYHLGLIDLINRYPIIEGIGNLHFRLGFNQSYFAYSAFIDNLFLVNGYRASNFYIALIVLIYIINLTQKKIVDSKIAILLLLPIVIALRFTSSPSPDVYNSLVQVIAFILYLDIFIAKGSDSDAGYKVSAALLIVFSLFINKLSGIFFAIPFCLFLYFHLYRLKQKRTIGLSLIFLMIVSLIHIYRGYVQTGYPFFPNILFGNQELEWSVPSRVALHEQAWIFSWARQPNLSPDVVLNSYAWLLPWLKNSWLQILIFCGVIFGNIYLYLQSRNLDKDKYHALLILNLFLVITVFPWFFTAPDWRFLGSIPYLLIACTAFQFTLLKSYRAGGSVYKITTYFSIATFVLSFAILTWNLRKSEVHFSGWDSLPIPQYSVKETKSGLKINVPDGEGASCWSIPMPCTPYFNSGLHSLRGPAPGFFQDGLGVK